MLSKGREGKWSQIPQRYWKMNSIKIKFDLTKKFQMFFCVLVGNKTDCKEVATKCLNHIIKRKITNTNKTNKTCYHYKNYFIRVTVPPFLSSSKLLWLSELHYLCQTLWVTSKVYLIKTLQIKWLYKYIKHMPQM